MQFTDTGMTIKKHNLQSSSLRKKVLKALLHDFDTARYFDISVSKRKLDTNPFYDIVLDPLYTPDKKYIIVTEEAFVPASGVTAFGSVKFQMLIKSMMEDPSLTGIVINPGSPVECTFSRDELLQPLHDAGSLSIFQDPKMWPPKLSVFADHFGNSLYDMRHIDSKLDAFLQECEKNAPPYSRNVVLSKLPVLVRFYDDVAGYECIISWRWTQSGLPLFWPLVPFAFNNSGAHLNLPRRFPYNMPDGGGGRAGMRGSAGASRMTDMTDLTD